MLSFEIGHGTTLYEKVTNGMKILAKTLQTDPLEHFNGIQLFMADRWHHIEALCTK